MADVRAASEQVQGDVAAGVANAGNPLQLGGVAKTSLPAAWGDGQRAPVLLDQYGRQLVSQSARTLTPVVVANAASLVIDGSLIAAGAIAVAIDAAVTATIVAEGTIDGTTWFATELMLTTGDIASTFTNPAAATYGSFIELGFQQYRLRCTAFTSGTANLKAVVSSVPNVVRSRSQGNAAHGATDLGWPEKIGGKAQTAMQAALSNGVRTDAFFDEFGKLNVVNTNKVSSLTLSPAMAAGATLYTAGDQIGALQTLTNAGRVNGGSGTLQQIIVTDTLALSPALELWFFDTSPTNPGDNAAWNVSDGDVVNCIGVIPVNSWFASTLNTVSTLRNLNFIYKCAAGATSLFIVAVTRSAPTYTNAGTQLQYRYVWMPD